MRKLASILMLGFALLILPACASLKGKIPEKREVLAEEEKVYPYLTTSDKALLVIVGFNALEDKRPKTDISYMTSIREKISNEILYALRSIPLFDEVHFPAADADNIIISGEIRKFDWSYYNTMISYIPGLNVLPFLGLVSTRTRAEVEIRLEFKNRKTNEAILNVVESFVRNKSYNIYSFNPDKANAELASCFEVVLNKIKDDILLNKNKILDVVKISPPKIPKPAEDVKPAEEVKPKEETKPKEEAKPADNLKSINSQEPTAEVIK